MWQFNKNGDWEFTGGRDSWREAARQAELCPGFAADDEDEQTADDSVSCYNCRYRRWTTDSFVCVKPALP